MFIKLSSSIHQEQDNNVVLINPWEISSVCPRMDNKSIVITKRGFTYKVEESVEEIDDKCYAVQFPKKGSPDEN